MCPRQTVNRSLRPVPCIPLLSLAPGAGYLSSPVILSVDAVAPSVAPWDEYGRPFTFSVRVRRSSPLLLSFQVGAPYCPSASDDAAAESVSAARDESEVTLFPTSSPSWLSPSTLSHSPPPRSKRRREHPERQSRCRRRTTGAHAVVLAPLSPPHDLLMPRVSDSSQQRTLTASSGPQERPPPAQGQHRVLGEAPCPLTARTRRRRAPRRHVDSGWLTTTHARRSSTS